MAFSMRDAARHGVILQPSAMKGKEEGRRDEIIVQKALQALTLARRQNPLFEQVNVSLYRSSNESMNAAVASSVVPLNAVFKLHQAYFDLAITGRTAGWTVHMADSMAYHLSVPQLVGVIFHEGGHINNSFRDLSTSIVTDSAIKLGVVAGFAYDFANFENPTYQKVFEATNKLTLHSLQGKDAKEIFLLGIASVVALKIRDIGNYARALVTHMISRHVERKADFYAAKHGHAHGLSSGLEFMDVLRPDGPAPGAARASVDSLFSTHPKSKRRISYLGRKAKRFRQE